ncbi:MAG: sterol desaturase family protein [Myxococcales bacterium]|nr:sterol desaturase family protein [Myxococcales bacterium]
MPHWALLAICVVVPLVAVLLASREVRAWIRGTGSIRQTLSNAGVGAVFLLTQLLLRGALVGAFAGAAALVPYKLPQDAPWAWVLAFVLLDFVYYVQHRSEHAVPLLWAIHAVHHQSRDYNLSVSFRVGALASLSTMVFHLSLALAGVSASMYAAVVTVHAVLLFALHARTKLTFGPGRFFNAPVFHRVHHGAESAYVDKNFGGVLLVFDRLFGTFAPYTQDPTYGVIGERDVADHGPVSANVAPFEALLAAVRRQPTLRRKLTVLFVRERAR